jgi:hypothetical protein
VDWLPDAAFDPDQAPEAVHAVALVDDQLSVDEPPLVTVVGLALSVTVGAGVGGGVALTVTDTVWVTDPPPPVQVSEKLLVADSAPVDWLPDAAFDPDQAPEAVQDEALVVDQLSTAAWPLATLVGLAVSEIVGAGVPLGGGGVGPPPSPLLNASPEPPQAAKDSTTTATASQRAGVGNTESIRESRIMVGYCTLKFRGGLGGVVSGGSAEPALCL